MRRQSLLTMGPLLLVVLACHDNELPTQTGPATPQVAVTVAGALSFWQVSAGNGNTCAVTTEYRAYCWGWNLYGQLGIGTAIGPEICNDWPCSTRPVAVQGVFSFRQVSSGSGFTCGVSMTNLAYCWGYNGDGQLGDGTTTMRVRPKAVAGGQRFRQVAAGNGYTCGVSYPDNGVYCWGRNRYGNLGDGTTSGRLVPVAVASTRQFRQVETGNTHTCAVGTNDLAFCWGRNNRGQLGDSTFIDRHRPTRVVGARQWRRVDVGDYHTCGVTQTGRAFCWGANSWGQVGDGTTTDRRKPSAVLGGLTFSRVTVGGQHTCGEAAGRAYCWGANLDGELGDGTWTTRLVPVAVLGSIYWGQLSAGVASTCGKTNESAAYCWGNNFHGSIGDGTTLERRTPTAVLGPP